VKPRYVCNRLMCAIHERTGPVVRLQPSYRTSQHPPRGGGSDEGHTNR
jgi:hypothetical protein